MNAQTEKHLKRVTPEFADLWRKFSPLADSYLASRYCPEGEYPWNESTFEITDSTRDIYIQTGKWSQGREWKKNELIWIIANEGLVITRTLSSPHLDRRAGDAAPVIDGVPSWPTPEKEFNRQIWIGLAEIGKNLGFRPGAFFHNPDYPHYEI